MIKHITITAIAALLGFNAFAQGLEITKFKDWEEIKTKAKNEHKLILVDCYTTWCGPCKQMSQKVFPQESVGNYANDKFVSVKLQFDSTAKDDEYVQANYALARKFEKEYAIAAYPSFMVFDSDGAPLHRFVGAYNATEFVKVLEESKDETKQFYTILKKYNNDSNNVAVVKQLANAASQAYDLNSSNRAYKQLIKLQGDKLYQDKQELENLVNSSNAKGDVLFDYLLASYPKIKDNASKQLVNDKITNIIIQTDYLNSLFSSEQPDWAGTEKALKTKYPQLSWDKTIHTTKVTLAYYKKDQNALLSNIKDMYSKNYKLDDRVINSIAWEMFEKSEDKAALKQMSTYMTKNVESSKDAALLDTYANLLYKSGDKTNALKWIRKAVDLIDESNKAQFMETLQKMEKDEPTWTTKK